MTTPSKPLEDYVALWILGNTEGIENVAEIKNAALNLGCPSLAEIGQLCEAIEQFCPPVSESLKNRTLDYDYGYRAYGWLDNLLTGYATDDVERWQQLAGSVQDAETRAALVEAADETLHRLQAARYYAEQTRDALAEALHAMAAKEQEPVEHPALARARKFCDDLASWRSGLAEWQEAGLLTLDLAVQYYKAFDDAVVDRDYQEITADVESSIVPTDQALGKATLASMERALDDAYATVTVLAREIRPDPQEGAYHPLSQGDVNKEAHDLLDREEGFDVGGMGDCVSIVVLWDQNEYGVYRNGRACHGAGGFTSINMDSLCDAVPNNGGTAVIALMGAVADASSDEQRLRSEFGERLGGARLTVSHGGSRVNRRGEVK